MSEQSGVHEQPGHHEKSANQEGRATTPTIDEQKSRDGHDYIDDELNGGWEKNIATQASHGENVGDIVLETVSSWVQSVLGNQKLTHHDIHASEL